MIKLWLVCGNSWCRGWKEHSHVGHSVRKAQSWNLDMLPDWFFLCSKRTLAETRATPLTCSAIPLGPDFCISKASHHDSQNTTIISLPASFYNCDPILNQYHGASSANSGILVCVGCGQLQCKLNWCSWYRMLLSIYEHLHNKSRENWQVSCSMYYAVQC